MSDQVFGDKVAGNKYTGPVFHGSANGAQVVMNSTNVHQTANPAKDVAPGFEALAEAVVKTLEGLAGVGLPGDDLADARAAGEAVLTEVTKPEPDRGVVRRCLAGLRGFLTPVATRLSAGAAEGTQEWARTAIEQLGTPF